MSMTDLFLRISEEKRSRIIEAAINEFANYGYTTANTNKIARNANISVGSLFQYFDNKEDLFLTTVKHCTSLLETTLKDAMVGGENVFSIIEKLLRAVLKHSRDNLNIIRLYNEMVTQSNSKIIGEAVKEIEALSAKLYISLIEKAQQENIISRDCDSKMFAFLLDNLLMMLQFSYSCDYYRERFKLYAGEDVFSRDDYVIEQILSFIKAAFYSKTHSEE
jgi:AcrR family transcriptional regulator